MIVSIDAEKVFDKIQHLFMIKNSQKSRYRGNIYLNIEKAIYDKHTANIILNGKKLKAFPLRSRTRQGCLSFIQHNLGSPTHSNQERKKRKKEMKEIHIGKEEVKLSLFADDMILCIENPKDSTKNY